MNAGFRVYYGPVKTITSFGMLSLLAASGCQTAHHARVDHGAGLDRGSPVMVSGVRVGEVREVRVVEGQVDVEFVLSDDHEVTIREDTCALALAREGEGAVLLLTPGEGAPLAEERAIPQCELLPEGALGDLARQLGGALGDLLRQFGGGLGNGGGGGGGGGGTLPLPLPIPRLPGLPDLAPPPSSPSAPSTPDPLAPPPPADAPPPPSFDGVCEGLSVRVERVERAEPVLLHLPDGGHRVWLEFRNDSDRAMQVGSIAQASFTDAERRAQTPATVPGQSDAWFMPFEVPARATARRCVLFAGDAPRLDEIEARRSAPAAAPLDWCTLRAAGLSR